MNVGSIVTRALQRADISVSDHEIRDMANQMLNEIIMEHWEMRKWSFRIGNFQIDTSAAIEEYALNKYISGVQAIVPDTLRGSDPVRRLRYIPSNEFYRTHPYDLESGDPYWYREGQMRGFETDVSASSVITFTGSLTNYTTGTASVVYGLKRVTIAVGAVTIDMLGRWFRIGTDTKRYKIVKIESTTQFLINEPYEGATASGSAYAIGDVQQKGIVQGFLADGTIRTEEVQLNGATAVATENAFSSLVRVGKSDKTHGAFTVTSNGGVITNAILDAGETEADWQTVKLYQIPAKTEALTYEGYIKHPFMYSNTDSPLFPNQYHPLLVIDLYIRLKEEWTNTEIAQGVYTRRDKWLEQMISMDQHSDAWRATQKSDDTPDRIITNLPNAYGYDDSEG